VRRPFARRPDISEKTAATAENSKFNQAAKLMGMYFCHSRMYLAGIYDIAKLDSLPAAGRPIKAFSKGVDWE